MFLKNQDYEICLEVDDTYTINSADNRKYDYVYNPNCLTASDFSKTFSLTIRSPCQAYSIALVGEYYSFAEHCAILTDNILIVLQSKTILQIDVATGRLLCFRRFDALGPYESIVRMKNGYLLSGELEIMMTDLAFNEKWRFSGRDIFVDLTIRDDRIELVDFENHKYVIDESGNLLHETRAE